MDLVVKILFAVVLIVFVWWLLQPRRVFVVRIEGSRPRVVKGHVSAVFVEAVGDVCREFDVASGEISASRRGGKIVLAFSFGIPPACRQRLRNLWHLGPSP